jgi:flagellar biosynthesis anti-sigma factor FlgM
MKVNNAGVTAAPAGEAGRAQESQRSQTSSGTKGSASSAGGDRVEFSSTIGSLSKAISSFSSSRAAKVQALTAQYQSGNYKPDASVISKGMVSEALGAAR